MELSSDPRLDVVERNRYWSYAFKCTERALNTEEGKKIADCYKWHAVALRFIYFLRIFRIGKIESIPIFFSTVRKWIMQITEQEHKVQNKQRKCWKKHYKSIQMYLENLFFHWRANNEKIFIKKKDPTIYHLLGLWYFSFAKKGTYERLVANVFHFESLPQGMAHTIFFFLSRFNPNNNKNYNK